MTTPFEIKIGNNSDRGMVVELDNVRELAIPGHVLVGLASPEKRIEKLAKFYTETFTKEDPRFGRFRHTVASIQKHAVALKKLTIISNSRQKALHIEGFKRFLIANQEIINLTMSYILEKNGDEKDLKKTDTADKKKTPNQSVGDAQLDAIQLNGEGVSRLSSSDMLQIKTLLLGTGEFDAPTSEEVSTTATDVTTIVPNVIDVEAAEVKTVWTQDTFAHAPTEEVSVKEEHPVTEHSLTSSIMHIDEAAAASKE